MSRYKITRYVYGTVPSLVPTGEQVYAPDARRITGYEDDDEMTCVELLRGWHGHKAGAVVVTGPTVEGHPFVVVEEEKMEKQRENSDIDAEIEMIEGICVGHHCSGKTISDAVRDLGRMLTEAETEAERLRTELAELLLKAEEDDQ